MDKSGYSVSGDNSIEVAHRGAHLCSWVSNGVEQLYLSPDCLEGKAIRGGVPIIFPQFEEFGDGPRHGFARTAMWTPGKTEHGFIFSLTEQDPSWPFNTSVKIEFKLQAGSLKMILLVANHEQHAVAFTCALHTYFRVQDIEQTKLVGLKGLDYWTHAEDFCDRKKEHEEVLRFHQKTDRIYFNSRQQLQLTDNIRTIYIDSSGFEDTVVWNPWSEDAKNMNDLPDEDYKKMLCVEPARVNNPVELNPGQEWTGISTLTVYEN